MTTGRDDYDNKLNVYYQSSFSPENKSETIDGILMKYIKLFDKNNYLIVVIEDIINGGYA